MYIGARLFGIATYLCVLFFSLILLRRAKMKTVLNCFLAALVIIAFLYYPAPEADLFRIRQSAQFFSSFSWGGFLGAIRNKAIGGYSSTPTGAILFKIIGDTGIYGLIPAASCMICYGVIFYVIKDCIDRYQINATSVFISILVLFSADYFMPTISTVRSYIAEALVFFCIHLEAKKGRPCIICFMLYIIAAFMHAIGIAVIAIRLGALLFQKNRPRRDKIIYLIIMFILGIIVFVKYQGFFQSRLATFKGYMRGDTDNTKYSYSWEYIIIFIMLILQWVTLLSAKKEGLQYEMYYSSLYSVAFLCVIVGTVGIIQYTIFVRMSYFTTLIELPLMLKINKKYEYKWDQFPITMETTCAILMLLLTCSRGYLCSLKFFP